MQSPFGQSPPPKTPSTTPRRGLCWKVALTFLEVLGRLSAKPYEFPECGHRLFSLGVVAVGHGRLKDHWCLSTTRPPHLRGSNVALMDPRSTGEVGKDKMHPPIRRGKDHLRLPRLGWRLSRSEISLATNGEVRYMTIKGSLEFAAAHPRPRASVRAWGVSQCLFLLGHGGDDVW